MGKYDTLDTEYFAQPVYLAELISNGIYHGRVTIGKDGLELLNRKYPSLAGVSGELERDAIVFDRKHHIKYGLEIENYADYGMPRRILVYDACEYEREAAVMRDKHKTQKDLQTFEEKKSGVGKEEYYCCIMDLVLYLGQGHFGGRNTMRECMKLPEEILPYAFDKVQNYTYSLIEADYVEPEKYHTELRQFFQAMQCRKDHKKLAQLFEKEEFQHLSIATQKMITIHLNNRKLIQKVIEEEEDVCKAMRDWERELRQEGKLENVISVICKNLIRGISVSDIAEFLGEPLPWIESVCAVAKKYAPAYDAELIYQELYHQKNI